MRSNPPSEAAKFRLAVAKRRFALRISLRVSPSQISPFLPRPRVFPLHHLVARLVNSQEPEHKVSLMQHHPKVLVVDDDENIVAAFGDFLRKEHCTVLTASNADDAFATLTHQQVNLVITDIRMKWRSGVTLLIKIKQSYPDLPVIVITGYPNLISEDDIRHYGADHFFVKPLELNQLRDAVRSCLHRTDAQSS